MIKVVLSIGGNFTGTINADYNILMPTNDFDFFIFKMHYQGAMNTFSHFPGLMENAIRSTEAFKTQQWYKEVLKRKAYEEDQTEKDESVFKFLPLKTEQCTPSTFNFPTVCKLGLQNDEDF